MKTVKQILVNARAEWQHSKSDMVTAVANQCPGDSEGCLEALRLLRVAAGTNDLKQFCRDHREMPPHVWIDAIAASEPEIIPA